MKRLLAVSWEMPPMYGPRGTQVSRTLRELAALDWRPLAVCLAPHAFGAHWRDGVPVDAPAGVELIRVSSPEEWTAVRAAWRIVPTLRDYPDSTRVWVRRAAAAAVAAARAHQCQGLITFAQPWSDHLVGLRVSRATGLPWVAHFSDPWADSPYATTRQRAIWRRMEARVVRDAAGLVFVTAETADLVMAKYPRAWRNKVSVVPHGYDARRLQPPVTRPDPKRKMRLLYTGRFYAGVRTPLPLLRALRDWIHRNRTSDALEVIFVGPHVEEFERDAAGLGLRSIVTFRGRVQPEEAAREAERADALLVIDAPSNGPSVFLPSKLIEYLPLRKPIIGVTPEPGAASALLRRLGCPVAPPDDVAAIVSMLDGVVTRWRAGELAVGDVFDTVAAEFDIKRTTARLHEALTRAFA
jgi:glycosyltransferase involved in cell wall biosynthesis